MEVEIRNDSVLIKGYANCVDRDSKVLKFKEINDGNPFVEQVVDGAWARAIEQNEDIKVLLNHDDNYCLGGTKDNLKLKEDNVGLFAEFRSNNANIIKKAKDKRFVGWSFRFSDAKDSWGKTDSGIDRRYLHEFNLLEVSLLDDQKVPAYTGCCVMDEARSTEGDTVITEYRCNDKIVESNADEIIKKEEQRELNTKLKMLELELEI